MSTELFCLVSWVLPFESVSHEMIETLQGGLFCLFVCLDFFFYVDLLFMRIIPSGITLLRSMCETTGQEINKSNVLHLNRNSVL